jgi:hemerythrin
MGIEFDKEMVLDHPELDRHHAVLFARLASAVGTLDGTTAEVESAVSRFADELLSHLAGEEALMEETAFPDRKRHRSAHELFVADFLQMRTELREKGPTPLVAEWIRTRIPEWLRFHVRVNDSVFAAHLARRRPQPGDARQRTPDRRFRS